MALKQLILTRNIAELKTKLDKLREKDADFETRTTALKTREAELESSVNEINDETSDEDRKVVDEAVAEFEADQESLEKDKTENDTAKSALEEDIRKLQDELDEINKKAAPPPADPHKTERKVEITMNNRSKFFSTMEQRTAFVARDDVKSFLERVRGLKGETRAVTGGELGIPEVVLELLRDNLNRYSKLITKVRLKPLKGKARQNITGAIPEGIWTEAVGELNELALSFSQIEMDGYRVGGFIPIPNSTLEDSDINLAEEIMDALSQAIGYAVDKAIVYGTGTKMPLGIVPRLAQSSQPSDWGTNAPAWTDLHTTNLVNINPASLTTAEAYFAALIPKLGVAKPNYSSSGTPTWIMNRITHMALIAKCLAFNAAAALVAGMNNTMPVIGGDIVEFEFMSDNDIVGGFLDLYTLVERAGASIASSEHVKFIQDQTVFKGTARYDGEPVFGEAFVGVNINNSSVTASKSFAADAANTVATPKALPIAGAYTGAQSVALTCDTPGAVIHYTTNGSTPTAASTTYNGPIAVAATSTIKAIAVKSGMIDSAVLTAAYTIS